MPSPHDISVPPSSTARVPVPAALRWMAFAVVGLVVVLAALPVAMAVDPAPYEASIARAEPSLGAAEVDDAFVVTLWSTAVLHALYAAVTVWLTVKVFGGRRWARIALTVAMVGATLNSIDSALAGPEYYLPVIAGDLLHLVIVVLLWTPASVRAFFAAHRAVAR